MNAYRGTFGLLLLPLGVVAALSAPGEARACSLPPEFRAATASFENDASYPSNAVFFFDGAFPGEGGVEAVEVQVDGSAASLVTTEGEQFGAGPGARLATTRAFRVSPEPRAGQRVVIRGIDCGAVYPSEDAGPCPEVEFRFTAAAPDTTPPALPAVTYGVGDYALRSADCGESTERRVFARLAPPLEGAALAPVEYVVEGFADEALTNSIFTSYAGGSDPNYEVVLARGVKCVRIQAYDYAGNETQAASVECALPALPPAPAESDDGLEEGENPPGARLPQSADTMGCHVSAAAGARPAPWAALLGASALLVGRLCRRRAATR